MTSEERAAEVLEGLRASGLTLASAESLTGGGLGAVLTSVPGASTSYAGGVIAYATRLKVELLAVPIEIILGDGAVSAPCARAMATGVRRLMGADVGVATTGVAGPGRQEGKPAGTVFVAAADAGGESVQALSLPGDRAAIRTATVAAALELLVTRMSAKSSPEVFPGG